MLAARFARCAVAVLAVSLLAPAPARSAAGVRAMRPHATAPAVMAGHPARNASVPSNITVADPPVARPDTKPCAVTLFTGLAFEDFNPKPFTFAPPAACPTPWSKVVLSVDLSVTAGVQFDRTATIGLDGATIFFGTTAEPFSNEGPSWNVQRDLTDLTALFTGPHNGQVSIFNIVNTQYTGIIHGSAKLLFYPPDTKYPAPRVADVVVPLADSSGNPVPLASPSSVLSTTFTPPTNVENAYLDVIAQSQSTDEFWYTCVPNNLTGPLNDCGSTSFRETDALLDGQPAGVSPVYPWIYTGGIDPFLWAPTPGVQTLNFVPYRIDLTPFAATLDNGAQHQVALSVFNADNYFSVTGNLLLFLDHGATQPLTGALDTDTLLATPPETTTEKGTFNPNGSIDTLSARSFTIAGHVDTSHGIVRTQVNQSIQFVQHEKIINSATQFEQNIAQDETVSSSTLTSGSIASNSQEAFDYPLQLVYDYTVNADGTSQQQTTLRQGYSVSTINNQGRQPTYWSFVSNTVAPKDTLHFDASGNFTGFTNNASSQVYQSRDSLGGCYGRKVASQSLIVTTNRNVSCGGGS